MRYSKLSLVLAGVFGFYSNATMAGEDWFKIALKSEKSSFSANSVLFEGREFVMTRPAAARDSEFQNIYAAMVPPGRDLKKLLGESSEILSYVADDFAVLRVAPEKLEVLSAKLHRSGLACGALNRITGTPISFAREPRIAATPIVSIEQKIPEVSTLQNQVNPDLILKEINKLVELKSRFHTAPTGLETPEKIAATYRQLAGSRSDVEISLFDHGRDTPQKSVIVRIPGKTHPEEIVILGSHIDSISNNREDAPGADDNASGTATNMEIFRILMASNFKGDRTLEIHGYAAEEIGLVGSQSIASAYKAKQAKVVAMMQFDMNLFHKSNAEDKIWFITNSTDSGLTGMIEKLAKLYQNIPTGQKKLWSGSSDHRSWTQAGYAAVFPFEDPDNYNNRIHTPGDTIANATAISQSAEFAKLGIAYAAHFAGNSDSNFHVTR